LEPHERPDPATVLMVVLAVVVLAVVVLAVAVLAVAGASPEAQLAVIALLAWRGPRR